MAYYAPFYRTTYYDPGQQMNPMAQLVADAKRLQQTMTGNPNQMVE